MTRSRLVFYAILVAAAVMVGGQAVLASSDAIETPLPTPARSVPAQNDWHVSGTIQAMNGEFWTIDGQVIRVTSSTRVSGDVPVVGSYANATGTVLSDGTWQASELRIGRSTAGAESGPAGPAVPTPIPPPTGQPSYGGPPPDQPPTPVPTIRRRRDQRRWPGYERHDREPWREGEHWRSVREEDD